MIINHVDPKKQKCYRQWQVAVVKKYFENESKDDVVYMQKGVKIVTCINCKEIGHYKNSKDFRKAKGISKSEVHLIIATGVESGTSLDTLSWTMVTTDHNMINKRLLAETKLKSTCIQVKIT